MRSSDIVLVAAHPLNSDASGHRTSPWCRYSMNPSASTPSRTVADHFVGRWTDEEVLSLDGYASAVVWPGWWGLQGPEYLAWLGEQPEVTYLMGADTYRLMSGFAAGEPPAGQDDFAVDEEASVDELTRASKVVFSASLDEPLAWANTTLVRDDAVEAVQAMKEDGSGLLSTIASLSLCRSLLPAGLVERFPVVMFPVITGATGAERICDGYPDVALEMIDHRPSNTGPACSSTHRLEPRPAERWVTRSRQADPSSCASHGARHRERHPRSGAT